MENQPLTKLNILSNIQMTNFNIKRTKQSEVRSALNAVKKELFIQIFFRPRSSIRCSEQNRPKNKRNCNRDWKRNWFDFFFSSIKLPVDSQNALIDDINTKVDKTSAKVKNTTKRVEKVQVQSSAKVMWVIICILLLGLITVTVLAVYL